MTRPARGEWVREALTRHERDLVAYALRFTRDLELARDAVQETFLALCGQPRERLEGRVREWLFHVCRNNAIDLRRREDMRTNVATGEEMQRAPSRTPGPDESLEHADTLASVLDSLRALPEAQQEVLVLKFRHGLAYREIARVTGRSVASVGTLLHLGVKALRARHTAGHTEGDAKGRAS